MVLPIEKPLKQPGRAESIHQRMFADVEVLYFATQPNFYNVQGGAEAGAEVGTIIRSLDTVDSDICVPVHRTDFAEHEKRTQR